MLTIENLAVDQTTFPKQKLNVNSDRRNNILVTLRDEKVNQHNTIKQMKCYSRKLLKIRQQANMPATEKQNN